MNARRNARKACCPRGHWYDHENTYQKVTRRSRRDGQQVVARECRTCARNRMRERRGRLADRNTHMGSAATVGHGVGSAAPLGATGRVPAERRGSLTGGDRG